jgi:hypothetical protein
MEEREYSPKVEDPKFKAAGWEEDFIGLWSHDDSVFVLDTNAMVGVIYHRSYQGFDGALEFFYTAEEALTWIAENEERIRNQRWFQGK